jgi:hypothetical protein
VLLLLLLSSLLLVLLLVPLLLVIGAYTGVRHTALIKAATYSAVVAAIMATHAWPLHSSTIILLLYYCCSLRAVLHTDCA